VKLVAMSGFRLSDLAMRAAWGGMLDRREQLELVREVERLREENARLTEQMRETEK